MEVCFQTQFYSYDVLLLFLIRDKNGIKYILSSGHFFPQLSEKIEKKNNCFHCNAFISSDESQLDQMVFDQIKIQFDILIKNDDIKNSI